jgi:hypothetical protein
VGDKDIKVLELKTSFVMALLEVRHFDNKLVLNIATTFQSAEMC